MVSFEICSDSERDAAAGAGAGAETETEAVAGAETEAETETETETETGAGAEAVTDAARARAEILRLVAEYCDRFHGEKKPFAAGDRIHYAGRVFDRAEMVNLADGALEFWLTSGRYTEAFEARLAAYIGAEYCAFVNSGSSANLLAFMALTSPLLGERAVRPGDEVITVAAGFPTTVAPVVQYGAVPVFADITVPQYNVDVSMLEAAVSDRTKAVMLAHTMGNPFDVAAVKAFCAKYGLWLIEDNCDALGSAYVLDGETRKTGSFGDVGTSSFYPPHHMTTGEGGAVYTSDPLLARIIRSMRDWGRDCVCASGQDDRCGRRFLGRHGELPMGYDHKYVYSHFGYNLKATDLQAAIGVAQLDKLEGFGAARRRHFARLRQGLGPAAAGGRLVLPEACVNADPSWFGFLLTCGEGVSRDEMVRCLERDGIQTRMLFAGNILRQPCFDAMRRSGTGYRVAGELVNTDRVMRDTFWVGVYPGMTEGMLDYMAERITSAVGGCG
jgi:CDP-6-deoxy-D-xylo-4-hexulose-3-dehydrase